MSIVVKFLCLLKTILKNIIYNKQRDVLSLCFISYLFFTGIIFGQGVSASLDSIHQLEGNELDKLPLYENILKKHQENNDFFQLGEDAHELGRWLYKVDIDKAIQFTEIAVTSKRKSTPVRNDLLKKSLYSVGYFNRIAKRYYTAIQAYQNMLAIKDSSVLDVRAYIDMAKCYMAIEDPYNAVKNYEKVFSFYDDEQKDLQRIITNHVATAIAYKNIRDQKSRTKELHHLKKAETLITTLESPRPLDVFNIYNNLGSHHFQGVNPNLSKALYYFEKALSIAKKIGEQNTLALIHYNLGILHTELNTTIAKSYLLQSLKYIKSKNDLISSIHLGLGIVAHKETDYVEAHQHYTKAFSYIFNVKTLDHTWLPNTNQLHSIANKSFLLELLKRKVITLLAQGKTNKDSNKLAIKVVRICDSLIDLTLSERLSYQSKLLWRDLASEIYILGLEACYRVHNTEEALYFMEKNKAVLLLQEVSKKEIVLPRELLEKEITLKNTILSLQNEFKNTQGHIQKNISKEILQKKQHLEHFQDSLSILYPMYSSNTSPPEILSLDEIKTSDNQIVLQYTMAERVAGVVPNAYGMIISKETSSIFKIDGVDKLLSNIKELRQKLNTPFQTEQEIASYRALSYEVYNTIIPKEIQKYLKNKKVTIISDHIISFIPFEALTTDVRTGTYLIEESEIHYQYSLSFQKKNTSISRNPQHDYLGLAPVHFSNNLTSLSNSKKEISSGNSFYDGTIFISTDATKENFIKHINNYKILHLATHADASDTITPWIAFRNSNLNNQELSTLKSQADLVILSACKTSLGEIHRGEGVMSLARSFFTSGANTVVSSLWNTNDKATTVIISDFYQNLSIGKTKSEALHVAKLNYLRNNIDAEASPYYWAPLILIGDPSMILPNKHDWSILWISVILLPVLLLLYVFKKYR